MSCTITGTSTPEFNRQLAQSFGKACDSYVSAARLQQQVATDALRMFRATATGHLLELGCGPGWQHPHFSTYCQSFTALDLSAAMLQKAQKLQLAARYLQADAQAIPLASNSIDRVFSSLMLQWCPQPEKVFSEILRVLKPAGEVVIATLTDGTLNELKQAFSQVDDKDHVNRFLPTEQLMAMTTGSSGITWQFSQRGYTLYYPDVQSLARELKALGANQVRGRQSTGLSGKKYWQQLANAYEPYRAEQGLVASYQVLFMIGKSNDS